MIKNFHTISIIASLFLFVTPCYSICCRCNCDEDEETGALMGKKEEYLVTTHVSLNIQQQQQEGLRKDEQVTASEFQIVSNGKIQIQFPTDLILSSNDDGSKSLVLKKIFCFQIFPNYDQALKNSSVLKMHQVQMNIQSKASLTRKFVMFCTDARERVNEEDKPATEKVISCIQLFIDQNYPEEGPFNAKFAEDEVTQADCILFNISEGAFLVKGPPPKSPEQK